MQIDLTPFSFMHFCRVFGGKLLVRSCVIIYKQQTYTFDAQLRWYMVAACWVHPVTSVSLRGHYERGAFLVQERIFLSFLPNGHSIPFFRFAVLSRTSFTRSLARFLVRNGVVFEACSHILSLFIGFILTDR